MKKHVLGILLAALIAAAAGALAGESRSKAVSWEYAESYTVTKGKFEFKALLSKDGGKAWIYSVKAKKAGSSPTSLTFPAKVKEAKVVRLGMDKTVMGSEGEDAEFNKTIFGEWVERAHGVGGAGLDSMKIKKMVLPSSVTEITPTAFSGMKVLEKVKIPDGVKYLYGETFYDCPKLKEVTLPKKMIGFQPYSCFDACPKLDKVILPKKNKAFVLKNNMILTKNGKTAVWAIPKKKKIKVPASVRKIVSGAFYGSLARTVTLGKKVSVLEADSICGTEIEKVKVDPANATFAKDGQCIYYKKNGTLAVGVSQAAELVISRKVKKITRNCSICGTVSEDRQLYLLDIPASVKCLGKDWLDAFDVSASGKVYFRKSTPPRLEKGGDVNTAPLPIFCKVYVPKSSLKKYQKWYRESGLKQMQEDGLEDMATWKTF